MAPVAAQTIQISMAPGHQCGHRWLARPQHPQSFWWQLEPQIPPRTPALTGPQTLTWPYAVACHWTTPWPLVAAWPSDTLMAISCSPDPRHLCGFWWQYKPQSLGVVGPWPQPGCHHGPRWQHRQPSSTWPSDTNMVPGGPRPPAWPWSLSQEPQTSTQILAAAGPWTQTWPQLTALVTQLA